MSHLKPPASVFAASKDRPGLFAGKDQDRHYQPLYWWSMNRTEVMRAALMVPYKLLPTYLIDRDQLPLGGIRRVFTAESADHRRLSRAAAYDSRLIGATSSLSRPRTRLRLS
ncbi:hypothetical protein VRRI112168_03485 [Vreelandella rituensis]|uniref:hypothetical protein n=1 Tax=Vreelandella rituensis TaxID=2282306 RepID=UPI0011C06D46|nr:hypothetical protein [Halomonas rituensis]